MDPTEPEEIDCSICLPEFEGPLDLLLHLIKKHELSILDIPIAFITTQYLQTIETMQRLHIDLAAEYLLMAATLCHIKSRELLPREERPAETPEAEEGEDPRQALIRRLLEYQKYKAAAAELAQRPVVGRNVFVRSAPPEQTAAGDIELRGPLQEIPVWALIEALERILSRARVSISHEVTVDRLSLADKINELSERLEREAAFTFESCFAFVAEADGVIGLRGHVVVTFMAILEMARLRLLRIHQAQPGGEIYLMRPQEPPPPGSAAPS
ncbi:MAG: segregation/condensation protein A [Myxococcales bacterium]|nr:segregation/condensation protein A [Myxococcota bacterium]MDW8283743.1 segregation/condensation protein A [Myxococcales bacterium]